MIFSKRLPSFYLWVLFYLVGNEKLVQENPMNYIRQGAGVNVYNIDVLIFS